MKNAAYRKHNDRTLNSSTYHKKDGTPIRAILDREAAEEIKEDLEMLEPELKRREELKEKAFNLIREWDGKLGEAWSDDSYAIAEIMVEFHLSNENSAQAIKTEGE